MTRLRIFSIGVAIGCALVGCTAAQIGRAEQACASVANAAATADQIGQALLAAHVAPAKIAPIVAEIERGAAVLTASCAVIASLPPPPAAAAPGVQPVT